eukprot:TRINITY_DN8439_c0_g1_i6.p1 TRINITY_DN8439_c0_g1~~TRINITY_DN8439_c0_g1_i6.p1  ORF type:complete len:187 (-),score=11.34 TRINITY_DN8439_c0_g1_i6:166-726(-)
MSQSYLFILFNFGESQRPVEDQLFFVSLHRLVATVVRLTYGIAAQKRAEVEFGRVFYTQLFNHAQHKYRNDPDVCPSLKSSDRKQTRKGGSLLIKNIRQASRVQSDVLKQRPTGRGALALRSPVAPKGPVTPRSAQCSKLSLDLSKVLGGSNASQTSNLHRVLTARNSFTPRASVLLREDHPAFFA